MNSRLAAAAALLAVIAVPAAAQRPMVTCDHTRTVRECFDRYVPTSLQGERPSPAEVRGTTAREVEAKPTGTDLSSLGALTGIRDFLPRLAGALLAPAAGEAPSSFGLKLNLPVHQGLLFAPGITAQGAAVLHRAEPSQVVLDSVPALLRDASRRRIAAVLEPYEDLELRVSANAESIRFGRSIRFHQDAIEQFLAEIVESEKLTTTDVLNLGVSDFWTGLSSMDNTMLVDPARAALTECTLESRDKVQSARFSCLSPTMQDSIAASIARHAATLNAELRAASAKVRAAGVLRLARLIDNQPQLNGSLSYRNRGTLVGADEWTGTARFEMGFANMNALRRACGRKGLRAECLREFVKAPEVQRSLARGDRVWAQVDLTRRASWRVSLPQDSVELALGAATTVALSGGYGAYLGRTDTPSRDRIDLQVKYGFSRDDVLRQDRLVSTFFYTRRLTDQSSALIGLTYANRPELVGQVARRLGANVGLTYTLRGDPAATP